MPLGLQDGDEDDPECEVEELDLRNGILKALKFLFKAHGRADTLVFYQVSAKLWILQLS